MYEIANWQAFEPVESRRPAGGLSWIQTPTALDSRGAVALAMLDEAGMMAYGVFLRLCQWHGNQPAKSRTGRLAHSDGEPMSLEHIAFAIGLRPATVERALSILAQKSVRWIEIAPDSTGLDHARSTSIKSDQDCSLEEKRREEKKEGDPSDRLSLPAVRKDDRPAEKALVELAEQTAAAWNREKADRCPEAWPDATKPRQKTRSNLAARVRDSGGPQEFAAAFDDRIARMAASPHYRGENDRKWTPSLPWLLEANGWEKAGNLPPPGAKVGKSAKRVSGLDALAAEMMEEGNGESRSSLRALA